MEKKTKIILGLEIVLTVFGCFLAGILLYRTITMDLSILGLMASLVYLLSYVVLVFYTTKNYKKEGIRHFQYVIYVYAALLGIQILQAGNFISDYGLSKELVLIINCCNLISFANVIKFAHVLNSKKQALWYMWIAVGLKLAIEVYLIVKMFAFIKLIHILLSLSVPILGITIIVAYLNREKRLYEK